MPSEIKSDEGKCVICNSISPKKYHKMVYTANGEASICLECFERESAQAARAELEYSKYKKKHTLILKREQNHV